jgi:hypothetical protein
MHTVKMGSKITTKALVVVDWTGVKMTNSIIFVVV